MYEPKAASTGAIRVAHILPWPTIGGVERATSRVCQLIALDGFESVAFCAGNPSDVADSFRGRGIETVQYLPAEPSLRRPRRFLKSSLSLARQFKVRRIDVIHCSDVLAAYHAGVAGKLARIPVICHVRCEYSILPRREQALLRLVDQFVFVSRHTESSFAYKPAEDKRVVLYDGIALNAPAPSDSERMAIRAELGIPLNAQVVGMVARVAPIKDYGTLVRAAARVLADCPSAFFVVIGDTGGAETYRAHFESVKSLLAQARISDRFLFTGFRHDVARLTGALDIAVLVTHSEGLPLVLLESMAAGLPVVATAVGGIPEIVTHGETGLLHDHQDDVGLAKAIVQLLTDKRLAARLGTTGQRFVRETFQERRFADELEQLYTRLAGRATQ